MTLNDIDIRVASPKDADKILKVYAPYVEKTVITFEYEVPSVEEFKGRIENTLKKYPYIVAVNKATGEIEGYAYTGTFKARAAYDWSVETTIYLSDNAKGIGLGKKLYDILEEISRAQGILNMNACIGYPEIEDEYLTQNSAGFHEHIGYKLVGEFHKCGYKFGRWYNMIWMEKMIGEHVATQPPIIPFPELDLKGIL
ncbi:MAG: GNAT family N-acetyltransferase [Butyrivibrio sp.]|nr:GNAT family N-acetyltransferase [Butyrivibrio sp.]